MGTLLSVAALAFLLGGLGATWLARRRRSRTPGESAAGSERVLLEQLFETAPEAIVLADIESRVIRTNTEFTRMFGYTRDEARGKSLDDLLAPTALHEEAVAATARVATGGQVSFETVRRRKDGTPLDVSVLGTPIRLAGGRTLVYGIYRDITQLKHTLEALRASEEKFSLAFRSAPGPATISAAADGRLLDVNDAFVAIMGYTRDEVLGRSSITLGIWAEPIERERMVALVERDGMVRDFEYTFRTKKGELRSGLFSADLVQLQGESCLLGLTNDITERKHAERAMRESEERSRTILETIEDGYYELDTAGKFTACNPALERLLGHPASQLVGFSYREFVDAENAARVEAALSEVYASGTAQRTEWVIRRADGERRGVEASVAPVRDAAGWIVGYRGMMRDATERLRTAQALSESEERYALAARGSNDGLWDWDLVRGAVYYSARWKAMLGYGPSDVGPALDDWLGRVHPEDVERVRRELDDHLASASDHFESEHRLLHRDGSYRWVLCRGVAERDGQGRATRMAGSLTDVSDRKWAEERLVHDALHDVLTGLPNRALFTTLLDRALIRLKRRRDSRFAVLFLDVDRFKMVNDSLGHMVGDQLLIEVARRLGACVRPEDTVARLGGDEFTILLEDIHDPGDAIQVAERIQAEFIAPVVVGAHEVFTSASLGIALSDVHYLRPEEVLRDADTAMYRAKSRGRARHEVFDADMHRTAVSLLRLETDLRRALERHEFGLAYQPVVSVATGRVSGLEALLRWHHPERGLVSPQEFIRVAEETGLIVPIGQWVLREACRQMHRWRAVLPDGDAVSVSVNLSARQFADPTLVDVVEGTLAATGLPASGLRLEITESILMDHAEASVRLLTRLKELGIQVEVDDFGTGYSSLGYLHRFPLDALKVDRSFVNRVEVDAEHREIVRTIVTLARNLSMAVVAEGVETEGQRAYLKGLGCDAMQGYLFAGPLEPDGVAELLKSRRQW
jgi:diguanylate cyclase (GGDEF)-like protein/PAS domain S-box-containing protein